MMNCIFGRFIDCFLFWFLLVLYGGNVSDEFWILLSANANRDEYLISLSSVIFLSNTADYFSEVWSLYVKKTWREFEKDVLANHDKIEGSNE